MRIHIWGWAALLSASCAFGQSEFTIYDLLPPATHKFAIVYDVSTSEPGAKVFLNPIRKGSKVTEERVLDLATGKELKWENVTENNGTFLKVQLAAPVPKVGQARIRILKTYEDAPSYYAKDDTLVFDRPLGIRRNIVLLPPGYELIGCSVPATVSIQSGGRVRIGMVNDRDDQLPVKIVGRKLP